MAGVTGAIVEFKVDGKTYEGEVTFLSDGTCEARSNFKPVGDELADVFQAAVRGDNPEEKTNPFAGAVTSEVVQHPGREFAAFQSKPDTDRAINHSIAVFFAEKSGSKDILDPVWLDIGVVSVATAYHPKCGKVTFLAWPRKNQEHCKGIDTFLCMTISDVLRWKTCDYNTLTHAKNCIAENWTGFCKQHEPTIKQEPEWLQVKDCIWVCEHNVWTACLVPSLVEDGKYISRAWKTQRPAAAHISSVPILPLGEAKAEILSKMK